MADYPIDSDCIFCKIIDRAIPCSKVFENKHVLAFLDINPISEGHTLVIPKAHYPTLLEIPKHLGTEIFDAMRCVASAVIETTKADGFNCIQNNFSAAGQMVFHTHWHIIPRFNNDGLTVWPSGKRADQDDLRALANAIQNRITP